MARVPVRHNSSSSLSASRSIDLYSTRDIQRLDAPTRLLPLSLACRTSGSPSPFRPNKASTENVAGSARLTRPPARSHPTSSSSRDRNRLFLEGVRDSAPATLARDIRGGLRRPPSTWSSFYSSRITSTTPRCTSRSVSKVRVRHVHRKCSPDLRRVRRKRFVDRGVGFGLETSWWQSGNPDLRGRLALAPHRRRRGRAAPHCASARRRRGSRTEERPARRDAAASVVRWERIVGHAEEHGLFVALGISSGSRRKGSRRSALVDRRPSDRARPCSKMRALQFRHSANPDAPSSANRIDVSVSTSSNRVRAITRPWVDEGRRAGNLAPSNRRDRSARRACSSACPDDALSERPTRSVSPRSSSSGRQPRAGDALGTMRLALERATVGERVPGVLADQDCRLPPSWSRDPNAILPAITKRSSSNTP